MTKASRHLPGEALESACEENEKGRPWFNAQRHRERDHLIERVGADLRGMMAFIHPKTVTGEGQVVDAPSRRP